MDGDDATKSKYRLAYSFLKPRVYTRCENHRTCVLEGGTSRIGRDNGDCMIVLGRPRPFPEEERSTPDPRTLP